MPSIKEIISRTQRYNKCSQIGNNRLYRHLNYYRQSLASKRLELFSFKALDISYLIWKEIRKRIDGKGYWEYKGNIRMFTKSSESLLAIFFKFQVYARRDDSSTDAFYRQIERKMNPNGLGIISYFIFTWPIEITSTALQTNK